MALLPGGATKFWPHWNLRVPDWVVSNFLRYLRPPLTGGGGIGLPQVIRRRVKLSEETGAGIPSPQILGSPRPLVALAAVFFPFFLFMKNQKFASDDA